MNLKDKIIDVLKLCFDPEIPVDLWSLGLIYSIDIEPLIANLDTTEGLFGGVLMYALENDDSEGNWHTSTTGDGDYDFKLSGVDVNFDYNATSGKFTCDDTAGSTAVQDLCKSLIK